VPTLEPKTEQQRRWLAEAQERRRLRLALREAKDTD
jgi:Flp pilus assembly protein CpaB